jgi:hypothetical protein
VIRFEQKIGLRILVFNERLISIKPKSNRRPTDSGPTPAFKFRIFPASEPAWMSQTKIFEFQIFQKISRLVPGRHYTGLETSAIPAAPLASASVRMRAS